MGVCYSESACKELCAYELGKCLIITIRIAYLNYIRPSRLHAGSEAFRAPTAL